MSTSVSQIPEADFDTRFKTKKKKNNKTRTIVGSLNQRKRPLRT